MAMASEAEPIINQLSLASIENILPASLPAQTYRSPSDFTHDVFLAVNCHCSRFGVPRVGSQAASILTWEAIRSVQPDLVINAGTAGGSLAMGAAVGDVFVSTECLRYHDRNFHPTDENFYQYAIGSYPCFDSSMLAKQLNLKTGIISTGNSFISSRQERQQFKENQAAVKDMEASAIAEVAQLLNVPFMALKVITDLIDIEDCPQKQFDNNFGNATEHLASVVKNVIKIIEMPAELPALKQ